MKIRTQSVLAIVPVFIGVAAISGFLTYTSEQQENYWALHEESTALTISIAAFIDVDSYQETLQTASAQSQNVRYINDLEKHLRQILQWKQAKYVLVRSLDGQRLLNHFSIGHPITAHRPLSETAMETLQEQEVWISDIMPLNSETSFVEACTLLNQGDRAASVGVLCVGVSADVFLAQMAQSQRKVILSSSVIVIIGVILALTISELITKQIRQLRRAAETVASGDYQQTFKIGGIIQELQDLSNTFNTMSSVMEETLSRAKRSLVENERFRTVQALSKTYQDTINQQINQQLGSLHITGKLFNDGQITSDFLDYCATIDGHYFILGCLTASQTHTESQPHLDLLVTASATTTLLKQLLVSYPCEKAIAQAAEMFPMQTLHCMFVPRASPHASAVQYWHYSSTSPMTQRILDLTPGHPTIFHTLSPLSDQAEQRITSFAERFSYLSANSIVEDISIICETVMAGGILLVVKAAE